MSDTTSLASTPRPSAPLKAFILHRPGREGLRVAGLSLRRRWRRGLDSLGLLVAECAPGELAASVQDFEVPVLLADGRHFAEPAAWRRLAEARPEPDEAVVASGERPGLAPVAALGVEAARAVAARLAKDPDLEIPELLAALDQERALRVRALAVDDPLWAPVPDAAAAGRLTGLSLARDRGPQGSLLARLFYRPLAAPVSRALLALRLPASLVSTLKGLVGLAAAWLLLQPGYGWALVATALLQLVFVLDATDGQVARLRLESSAFGVWYDRVWDAAALAAFLAAAGRHVQLAQQGDWPWLALGLFAAGLVVVSLVLRRGEGGEEAPVSSLLKGLRAVFAGESQALVYLLAALLDALPVAIIVSTVVATGTLLLVVHRLLGRAARRRDQGGPTP